MTNLFSYLPFDNLCFFSDKYIIILHRVTLNKIMTISFKIIMKREAIHSIVHSFIHSYEPTCASVVSSEHASAPSSGLSKQHM